MPRPVSERTVSPSVANLLWKPAGIPAKELEELRLGLDEAEAIRLADLEGLYQEAAARRMGVSRQTFGRILEDGRRKVADALIHGKALRVEGGKIIEREDTGMHDKIAVPTKAGMVDEHFGHCDHFTVFELKGGAVASAKRVDSPDGCGCKSDIASTLARDGVTLMLAGKMGDGAVRVLKANGIDVIRGASGPIEKAVEGWLAGRVSDSGVGCAEHGAHDCSH